MKPTSSTLSQCFKAALAVVCLYAFFALSLMMTQAEITSRLLLFFLCGGLLVFLIAFLVCYLWKRRT